METSQWVGIFMLIAIPIFWYIADEKGWLNSKWGMRIIYAFLIIVALVIISRCDNEDTPNTEQERWEQEREQQLDEDSVRY